MPLVTIAADDPRTQPWSYITDGRILYTVVDDRRGVFVLENCATGKTHTIGRAAISQYRLVKAAPTVPDAVYSD